MADYRHATNLRVPFDIMDLNLLRMLTNYRIGDPVPAQPVTREDGSMTTPYTVEQLKRDGIVGLYTTVEALNEPAVVKWTGWTHPERVLGRALG